MVDKINLTCLNGMREYMALVIYRLVHTRTRGKL